MARLEQEQALRGWLELVGVERRLRTMEPWGSRVQGLKAFQQARLALTHADLAVSPRWGPACRFFLEELYGPKDYAERDRAFSRVVPALVRVFPAEVISTVALLLELHACAEQLDSAMARAAHDGPLADQGLGWDEPSYVACWRSVGLRATREWQVHAVHRLGSSLDGLVAQPGLRQALRLMRAPARLAGLAVLQQFLENGFDTFRAMQGAQSFLDTVRTRELAWVDWLFGDSVSDRADARGDSSQPPWLGQFPGPGFG